MIANFSSKADTIEQWLVEYRSIRTQMCAEDTQVALAKSFSDKPAVEWLDCARALAFRKDIDSARIMLSAAITAHPDSIDLRYALAGILEQSGDLPEAEARLRDLLSQHPSHAAAAFLLAGLLRRQGRTHAAASIIRTLFTHSHQDIDTTIRAVEMLDDMQRIVDAHAICEAEIAAGCTDSRIYAYAGMLSIQLGQFELTRKRYAFALENNPQSVEWNIPIGLSTLQRYKSDSHEDFNLFHRVLQQVGLCERTRITTLFALGKAYDDIADYAQAAHFFRQGNNLTHRNTAWSRKRWRRTVEARLASRLPSFRLAPLDGWAPLFIVGVPRSGTTLLAELLARHPCVCNRGELSWLSTLSEQLQLGRNQSQSAFESVAEAYAMQLRQDDSDALWFIDKQPLNLLHIDLILALWPEARIIYCQRNARDTALSLWSQSFNNRVHDYAYDFGDISAVIQGCNRLLKHSLTHHSASIRIVHYEKLIADPASCLNSLAEWLNLPEYDLLKEKNSIHSISTASAWQARQPINSKSVSRWRFYAPYVPELLRLPDQ